jgi:hypothetical protein
MRLARCSEPKRILVILCFDACRRCSMTKLFTKHDLNANYLHASPALELKLAGDKAAEGTIERLVSNFIAHSKWLIQTRFGAGPLRRMRAV